MEIKTTNPFKHAFPHARLYNVKLTSIARLTKGVTHRTKYIPNDDVRNFSISRADEFAKLYGKANGHAKRKRKSA